MKMGYKSIALLFVMTALAGAAVQKDIKILSTNDRQMIIEYNPQDWQQFTTKDGSVFSLANASTFGNPGEPECPVRMVTIGIPFQGDIAVRILDTVSETLPDIKLRPVPLLQRQEFGVAEIFSQNDSVYALQETWPGEIIRVHEPEIFRNQRIADLEMFPLQTIPATNSIIRYSKIVLQIDLPPGTVQNNYKAEKTEEIYDNLLLNYEQAKNWRQARSKKLYKPAKNTFSGDQWYKITIGIDKNEGIYKIDGKTLQDAGIQLSTIDPTTLQLFNNGGQELPLDPATPRPDSLVENPIFMDDGGDGQFNINDHILFYGHPVEGHDYNPATQSSSHYINHFTFDNVYWLTYGAQKGKRIGTTSSYPKIDQPPLASFRDLAFVENEMFNLYFSGFVWLGHQLTRDNAVFSHRFDLPGAIADSIASFRVRLAAVTNGSHSFTLSINGYKIRDIGMNGYSQSYNLQKNTMSVQGILLDGNNDVSIEYNPTSDITVAHVDWIELEYDRLFRAVSDQLVFITPTHGLAENYQVEGFQRNDIRVFNITDKNDIIEIINTSINSNNVIEFTDKTDTAKAKKYIAFTPATFQTVTSIERQTITDLRQPKNADYIIITHDDFYQQALRLEGLRETMGEENRLETEIVKISDIYNQFSWGLVDATAVRDFLIYAEQNWGQPGYVLLLGDGHFDYKDILGYGAPNLILPYETEDTSEINTRTSDDWFTYTKGYNNGMQMAIGRMPVQTIAEAQATIDKIINYETDPEFGDWQKTITIVADDELVSGGKESYSDFIHTRQAETLSDRYIPELLSAKKIYLMEYQPIRNASIAGVTKPRATEDLIHQINRGSLIINYIGHGNDELWAHERVLNASSDFDRISNGKRMALWVAATCEFAYWDQPQKQSLAERISNMPQHGSVAMVSSARLAYSGENAAFNNLLYSVLFQNYSSTGSTARIGDAAMMAKKNLSSRPTPNSQKYNVLGDPTMRLAAPRFRAYFDAITPDSIRALDKIKIDGHVQKDGQPWDDYNGKILVQVADSKKHRIYESESGGQIAYILGGNNIFRGVVPVTNGRFQARLIVPKDISYGGDDGSISAFFWNDETEGSAFRNNIPVGGTAEDLIDHEGPEIDINFGREDFQPGDYTSVSPNLTVMIKDTLSGVNIAGDIGHQITLVLDEDEANSRDLTELFQYDENSYTSGLLSYPLYKLEPGRHDLRVKAWDNSNNSAILESHFTVAADSVLRIANLLNYPNPMTDQTTISFELTMDAQVTLKIFSVAGRLLRSFEPVQAMIGYNTFPMEWDGRDQDGDKIANGVYLYKLKAKSIMGSDDAEAIGKLIIAR